MERIEKSPLKSPSEESDEETFKLTRAKARQLNKTPLKIPPLKIVSSEFSALIDKELGSDEEDDEYQPGDEEPPVSFKLESLNISIDSVSFLFILVR